MTENRDLEAKIARIEAEHGAGIERKNKQLDERNFRLKIKETSQDKGSVPSEALKIRKVEVDLAEEKKAHRHTEQRLKDEIAALPAKYKADMAKTTDLCEKKIKDIWEKKETELRQEYEKETAKLRVVITKQAEPNTSKNNTVRCVELKVYNTSIQTLQIRKQEAANKLKNSAKNGVGPGLPRQQPTTFRFQNRPRALTPILLY